jgi:hypothetical protein
MVSLIVTRRAARGEDLRSKGAELGEEPGAELPRRRCRTRCIPGEEPVLLLHPTPLYASGSLRARLGVDHFQHRTWSSRADRWAPSPVVGGL